MSGGAKVPDGNSWDCSAGLAHWDADWSASKKVWCCRHTGKACPSTAAPMSDINFDCQAGLATWQNSWSVIKKTWCCEHKAKGCPVTASKQRIASTPDPYECEIDDPANLVSWPAVRQAWCCKHKGKGCLDAARYICTGSTESWWGGHKQWCCKHKGKACE